MSEAEHVIADAAYDGNELRDFIENHMAAKAHIKRNPTRKEDRPVDWNLYKEHYPVERFFNKIKRFRRIALRCEKTISSFKAFIDIACAMIWSELVA